MASAKMRSVALLQSLGKNSLPIHVRAKVHCVLISLLVGRVNRGAVMLVENGIATVDTRKDVHCMRIKNFRAGVLAGLDLREIDILNDCFFVFAITSRL